MTDQPPPDNLLDQIGVLVRLVGSLRAEVESLRAEVAALRTRRRRGPALATDLPAYPDYPLVVTFEEAKARLKYEDTDHDAEISAMLEQSNDLILEYLKGDADLTWTPDTVPPHVKAAILIYLGFLDADHGDEARDPMRSLSNEQTVWQTIANILRRRRTPALA